MKKIVLLILTFSFAALSEQPRTRVNQQAIDTVLRNAVEQGDVPGVVAMLATPDRILYHAAFGKRDVAANVPMTEDTIFRIFSMTKPVTSIAVMQLIEQGKLKLDDEASKYLPALGKLEILTGFTDGTPQFKPTTKQITIRQLLTHTSGLASAIWDKKTNQLQSARRGTEALVFEPGERWLYGSSTDKLGAVVAAVSKLSLSDYFQQHIFQPLHMEETFFNVPEKDTDRMASSHMRQPDGKLRENPRQRPPTVTNFSGGGGLYSTASDYVKFMQMILNGGAAGSTRIVKRTTIDMMIVNQTGNIEAGRLTSVVPTASNDVDFHPGFSDRFGFGFLINQVPYEGGRARGSLAWAGAANTFFWIDPERKFCAVLLMQTLPFVDHKSIALLRAFEKAAYVTAER